MKNVLLLGLKTIVVQDVTNQLQASEVRLFAGTGLQDLHSAFDAAPIDVVIMGGGLDLSTRLELVRAAFERSERTSVHMKDIASGPEGFMPFVRAMLRGLTG